MFKCSPLLTVILSTWKLVCYRKPNRLTHVPCNAKKAERQKDKKTKRHWTILWNDLARWSVFFRIMFEQECSTATSLWFDLVIILFLAAWSMHGYPIFLLFHFLPALVFETCIFALFPFLSAWNLHCYCTSKLTLSHAWRGKFGGMSTIIMQEMRKLIKTPLKHRPLPSST